MNKHIKALENNKWICDYVSPWDSLLLSAIKPHQEEYKNIIEFIWCLSVSYRSLNSATRSIEFTIPICTNSIEDFVDSSDHIYFLSLD